MASVSNSTEEVHSGVFTCYVDGSWKNDEFTSGLGWALELQDGTTDLIGMKGIRRTLSPLHTEFHGLLWAMRSLLQHSRFCNVFVTDSKELTIILSNPEEWPGFQPEIREFQELKIDYPEFILWHRRREKNIEADCLAKLARSKNSIFSIIDTSVPFRVLNYHDAAIF